MEVGSLREKIIVALLMYKCGEANVLTDIPITEPEVDAKLFGEPISIKTITGKTLSGVKLIWTVDPPKAQEFSQIYYPQCDMLLVQINWGSKGGVYYLPQEAQITVFNEIGRNNYIKLPKPGTNPRGVEIAKEALTKVIGHNLSKNIIIDWQKTEIELSSYKRWVELWGED